MTTTYPWTEFFILWGLGLLGAALVLPYAMNMNPAMKEQVKLPLPMLLLITMLQNAVLLALAVGVGLLAARATGLGAPILESALRGLPVLPALGRILIPALGLGTLAGAAITALDRLVFARYLPASVKELDPKAGPLKGFLASFYGGISEELLLRLFMMTGLAWLLGRVWQAPDGMPAAGALVTAALLAALIFGAGHLPATRALAPLTAPIVARALLLNGIGGLIFGLLYWRLGLEAAMLAHFSADIVLHVLAPSLLAPAPQPAA